MRIHVLHLLCMGALAMAALPALAQAVRTVVPYTQPADTKLLHNKMAKRWALRGYENRLQEGGNPVFTFSESGLLASYKLADPRYKTLTGQESAWLDTSFLNLPQVEIFAAEVQHEALTQVQIRLFRRNPATQALERLVSFVPQQQLVSATERQVAAVDAVASAQDTATRLGILGTGKWGKIGITETGVYKLTADNLRRLGIDVANTDPRNLHIYGRGGEHLPEVVGKEAPGLRELAIQVVGQEDGKLDGADYVLFFAEGPRTWRYNADSARFEHANLNRRSRLIDRDVHQYADTIQYIVGANATAGLRVAPAPQLPIQPRYASSYTQYSLYEKEALNLLKGGRRWFSESFALTRQRDYVFQTPGLVPGARATLRMLGAARSVGSFSTNGPATTMELKVAGTVAATVRYPGVTSYPFAENYSDAQALGRFAQTESDNVVVNLSYNKGSSTDAVGYLDFIELGTVQTLGWRGKGFMAWWPEMAAKSSGGFSVPDAPAGLQAWAVHQPLAPAALPASLNGYPLIDSLPAAVYVFVPQAAPAPALLGALPNQSLATAPAPQLLIFAPPAFAKQAKLLADHRTKNGVPALVVDPKLVYNEFTGGHADLTALRDYIYTLYNQPGSQLTYVLMFGGGSFDYKNREPNNINFVPTYQSPEWDNPVNTWASDDYVVVMSKGSGSLVGLFAPQLPSIAVGRLSARTQQQANTVVEKIIAYETNKTSLGAWRNVNMFIADNGDGNTHTRQADEASRLSETNGPSFLSEKYYLSGYPLIAGPGGLTSPTLRAGIVRRIRAGALIVNYTGHGSEFQWADERIFDSESIQALDNTPRLPFFIAATCDFGRFDDPSVYSNGENLVTKTNGGGIASFSACRPVYSSQNAALHQELYRQLFKQNAAGSRPTLGQAVLATKTSGRANYNNQYILFGDPSLRLAYPRHKVVAKEQLGPDAQPIDTLRALQTITLRGVINKNNSEDVLTDFSGNLQITLYDKATEQNMDDGGSVIAIKTRNSIIFNGFTRVEKGLWNITFQLPLDINYVYGPGLYSFYAQADTGLEDANGVKNTRTTVGGSVPTAVDNEPPQVRLFMNDESFVTGGITGPSPTLVARLSDNSGINVSLSGIGHEMVGRFSNAPRTAVVMNSYYVSDLGKPNQGTLRYPLQDLPPGTYTVYLTVWDLQNNPTTDSLVFVVQASKGCISLARPSVVPNPASGTARFSVDTDTPGGALQVQVQVFNTLGQTVFTAEQAYESAPARLGAGLDWSVGASSLANGMYVYRLTTTSANGCQASAQGRLVINR